MESTTTSTMAATQEPAITPSAAALPTTAAYSARAPQSAMPSFSQIARASSSPIRPTIPMALSADRRAVDLDTIRTIQRAQVTLSETGIVGMLTKDRWSSNLESYGGGCQYA